jgi:hypothetical protein
MAGGGAGESGDSHSLAVHLEPVMREACGGRLGPVEWFHAAWQHGGAATGFAVWRDDADSTAVARVMVKIPVGPTELKWSLALGKTGGVVPRLVAGGDSLGGLDLCWTVVEKLEGVPLAKGLDASGVRDLCRAIVDFQIAAVNVREVDEKPKVMDWEGSVSKAKEAVKQSAIAEPLRWIDAIKHVQKSLGLVLGRWNGREVNAWCHGDLHPGNALRRTKDSTISAGDSPCVLIDLALVHAGHWSEDAVYLERQFWGHPEILQGVKPLAEVSRLRRERGLRVDTHDTDVAIARRVLMAAVVPLFLGREHNARYVHGALEVIEKYLPQLH